MYRVKRGRHAHGLDASGSELLKWDTDLHDAIDRGEIVAYFQPQYDARTGNLTGYEALARWQHPEHGALPPDRFIPLAEADGLIARLGDQIIEQACRFADLAAADRPLQMQVNVSVHQLSVPGLADRIRQVLTGYPDRTWTLDVEITESSLILDHALVRTELERIRDLGVGVSIDDFGSGYSSLSQLRDLPATELKIDKSFVHREDAVGRSLLTAILALAGSLDLTVVAEGVESRSQLATLRALGCDRLQGMYLCPPLIAEEALTARSDVAALLPAAD
jgi:EAL domain-containing protein (putative c-di-GMP-specific phosphodiesterase class I)